MWTAVLLFLLAFLLPYNYGISSEEEPILYYYGIEESERGLPACEPKRACAALLHRYWREDALVRLCRCPRRRRCDSRVPATHRIELNNRAYFQVYLLDLYACAALLHRYWREDALVRICRCPRRRRCDSRVPSTHRIELNNRAYFQFCEPVESWPQCRLGETSVVIPDNYDRVNPDELEELHHKNIQLAPPNITFSCRCRSPNYWRLKSGEDDRSGYRQYQCGSLPICRTGELCGHVTADLYALYQSCYCPLNHICVHNGGIAVDSINELLYQGVGWKAYCRRVKESSDEDYY